MSSLRLALKLSLEAPPVVEPPKALAPPKRKRSSSDANKPLATGNNTSDESDSGSAAPKRPAASHKGTWVVPGSILASQRRYYPFFGNLT